MSFRQALPEIRRRLMHEKQTEAYREWIGGLRDKATISIDNNLLSVE